MNVLVIVESPTKMQTIKGYLGKGYKVVASKGHVRDLPKSKLGVDIEHDFAPEYINIRGKGDLIKALKKDAAAADKVLLATDPDREGEAISWHLAAALGLDSSKMKRVSFNEITKSSVKEAINNPREIDMNLVNSQQTRRIVDRIVGYKISPFLWKKVKNGLSAGRVQSVATRLVVEREEEIRAFVPEEYWTIDVSLIKDSDVTVTAKFYGDEKKKIKLKDEAAVNNVLGNIDKDNFRVLDIKKSVKTKKPQPPYTTSTLQQDANRRLGMASLRTMTIAQELYEGINIGEKGHQGLITYMRTDSLRISDEARTAAKEYIIEQYGEEYYPATPNIYKAKKNSQDAHEAIRPSNVSLSPDLIKKYLSADQYKLYKIIWERFVASQMKSASFDTVLCRFKSGDYVFHSGGYTIKFRGFMAASGDVQFEEDSDDESSMKSSPLPVLKEGECLPSRKILPQQHFTAPPSRYTEGTLTKAMADMGIGRPSTFAPTIATIIARKYVEREGKLLVPTSIGELTTKLMKKAFAHIIDYNYTAEMEESLEEICNGKADYIKILHGFYDDFIEMLNSAYENIGEETINVAPVETDFICEKCGARMVEKEGKYGKFAACPNYPTCKNTKQLSKEKDGESKEEKEVIAEEKCPKCGNDMILKKGKFGTFFACRNYPECKTTMQHHKDIGVPCPKCGKKLVIKQTKTKRRFYSCEDYPNCDFSCWDIPQNEKCPLCSAMLLKRKTKDEYYCSDAKCSYKSDKLS